jgi:hypothetical protein
LALHQFREAEVENLEMPVFGDEEVLRLEVAMNDAFLVRRCQSMRDLNAVINRFANRDWTALQQLAQRAAFQQLGNQIRCAFEGSELVNGENVGMVEDCCCLRLLFESPQPVRIL